MEILITFLICVVATTVGAINGIGGGVIIKPILDGISSMGVEQVSFLSGCTSFAMAIVSWFRSRDMEKKFDKNIARALAIGAAMGGIIGKLLFNFIKVVAGNNNMIGLIQNIIMILLLFFVMMYMINKSHIVTKNLSNKTMIVVIGFALGIVSSFLGIGGGPINLIILFYFFSMDAKNATYNSIFIILLSQLASIFLSVTTNTIPTVDIRMFIAMIMGGIIGGVLGKTFATKMTNEQIEKLFFRTMIIILIITACNIVKFSSPILTV